MTRLLSVENAHISYGKVEAVRGATLDVNANEIVTIVGANGAGKTTLLNAIMGILPLTGSVCSTTSRSPFDIEDASRRACIVPEHRELFGTMTVEENLQLGGFRVLAPPPRQERVYALFPRLKERRAAGRHALRRRAADAGDGPRADEPAAPPDAGRAVARPCAADRGGYFPHHRRVASGRRFGAAGRAECPPRWRSPTAPM
jgi:ABC-type Fe3+/spermidine/putrescine transport system ATPase subunit